MPIRIYNICSRHPVNKSISLVNKRFVLITDQESPKLLPTREITLTKKLVTYVQSGPCDTKALCSFWLENYPANIRLEPNQP